MTNLSRRSELLQELKKRKDAQNGLIPFTKYTKPDFEVAKHNQLIAHKLEEVERKVAAGEGARLIICTPPRHTKSELSSRRFPAWCIGRHPNWQFIAATYSSEFAADFGREVRNIVSSQEYSNVFPEVSLRQDSKAANRWHTNHEGIYVSSGVEGPITGRGGHIVLIDDPYKDAQDANSAAIRTKKSTWYRTVIRTRLMPGAAIVLILTRWHFDDLAGELEAKAEDGGEQWEVVRLPALIETQKQKDADPLGRDIGESLWPEWYPPESLREIKKGLTDYEWSALYQQEPVPEKGNLFKRAWFNWYAQRPKHLNIYLCHDDAVTEDDNDFTEIGIFGVDEFNDVYVLDWWGDQATMDKWVEVLLEMIDKHSPIYSVGEKGVIHRASEPFIKKQMNETGIYCTQKWLPHIGDKVVKSSAFRGMASMGKIYLPEGKQWALDLITQLVQFPGSDHDDKVDACGLLGRAINQTWAPKVPVKTTKKSIHAKPTLNELLAMQGRKPKTDERL